jgi:hypothetical protein
MNTISYEGVVFTSGAIRLHRAADKSLRRRGRRESCVSGLKKVHSVSVLKGNAREFPDGGGKVDADQCPDNLLDGE